MAGLTLPNNLKAQLRFTGAIVDKFDEEKETEYLKNYQGGFKTESKFPSDARGLYDQIQPLSC